MRLWTPTATHQSVPMLYTGAHDALLEGPTWTAWWTQNSYGPTMTSLPFVAGPVFAWTAHSQSWWFNNMANGSGAQYLGDQGWAPGMCARCHPLIVDLNIHPISY